MTCSSCVPSNPSSLARSDAGYAAAVLGYLLTLARLRCPFARTHRLLLAMREALFQGFH